MSLTRCAAFVAALGLAGPAGLAAQDILDSMGPLEKEAKAITPENPIPRRIHTVSPFYPPEASAFDASANVTLRITLDRSGRVAEIRRNANPLVRLPTAVPSTADVLRSAGEALVRSAAAAVSQWQYDPPADAPISFNVTFRFQPDAEPTSTQAAGPAAPVMAGGRIGGVNPAGLPSEWAAARGALRVGGQVRAPMQVRKVNPVYPPDARDARVQGVVILEAIVGADGRVSDARILRSIPLLDQAALDAVRQWEYTPTLLNGAPVPIVMTVTVQFTLA